MGGKDVNKRVVENLIKAGALDSLGGNRQQFMMAYASIMDGGGPEPEDYDDRPALSV